jgi:hypothetical protein
VKLIEASKRLKALSGTAAFKTANKRDHNFGANLKTN